MLYKRLYKIRNNRGFTLIEVIIALVIAAVIGAMLAKFMGTGMMNSANPVILAQNGAYLNSIMEKMTSNYKYYMSYGALNGYTPAAAYSSFNSNVGTESSTKTTYSDSTHPYYIMDNHTITFSGSPATESAGTSTVHKITIKYRELTATALFTE